MAKQKSDPEADALEAKAKVGRWLNEIKAARKREKNFRDDGVRILKIYDGGDTATNEQGVRESTVPFNILFSNTQTMLPAMYSAVPRAVVQRRFKDEDPLGKSAATAGQRILEFLLDTNIEGYETFDEGMKMVVLDGLLPGRGVTTIKYDAEMADMEPEQEETKGSKKEEPEQYKKSELVCVDSRPWDRCYFGYAKKWSKVPWVAYENFIDEPEAVRLFGSDMAARLKFTTGEEEEKEGEKPRSDDDRHLGERKTALVYQIWDKDGGRKIRYVAPQYTDQFLLEQEDPLQLTGFFNCPKPLRFVDKAHDLTPTALYCIYENQASELNRITRRISHIVEAIKARGIYDSELGDDIKNLIEADDNQLVPADKSSSLAAEKGLGNAIWMWPTEQLVNVLQQLLLARENCKRVIYEITGISDIIRGSTAASETATAQQIKTQWGTLRLKNPQKEVQRFARDLLRMMLEIAATKFSEKTWAKMTGLPFLLEPKYLELTAVQQALQQQLMAIPPQPPAPPVPGQPAAPPSPNPIQMQLQQVKQQLQAPRWSQVLEMLRDDMQRAYRIDIETNSTIEPEAAEDQKQIAELMTALAQYLNGIAPLVEKGVMPFQAAQAMLLAITRRFRFGSEIEEYIKAMQAPKPQDDGKEGEQAVKDAQRQQEKVGEAAKLAEAQAKVADVEHEKQVLKQEHDLEKKQMKLDFDKANFDLMKRAADTERTLKSASDKKDVEQSRKMGALEQTKFKTENVVAKKTDETLGKGIGELKEIVRDLAKLVANVSTTMANRDGLDERVIKAITAPRRRKAIRGKDGRIAETIEEVG